jgi:IS5 family transposase
VLHLLATAAAADSSTDAVPVLHLPATVAAADSLYEQARTAVQDHHHPVQSDPTGVDQAVRQGAAAQDQAAAHQDQAVH